MAGEKLVNLIQDAARNGIPATSRTDLVWGTVKSVSPYVIQVDTDPNLRLTETFLKLSPLCLAKWFTIPEWYTEPAGEGPHTHNIPKHTVQVWRGLQVGDRVIMLRASGGNLYYVLQREGDL